MKIGDVIGDGIWLALASSEFVDFPYCLIIICAWYLGLEIRGYLTNSKRKYKVTHVSGFVVLYKELQTRFVAKNYKYKKMKTQLNFSEIQRYI